MEMEDACTRVARGAALLDTRAPWWARGINGVEHARDPRDVLHRTFREGSTVVPLWRALGHASPEDAVAAAADPDDAGIVHQRRRVTGYDYARATLPPGTDYSAHGFDTYTSGAVPDGQHGSSPAYVGELGALMDAWAAEAVRRR